MDMMRLIMLMLGYFHGLAGIQEPDFEIIKTKLKKPVIFDGRNLYDPMWPLKRESNIIVSEENKGQTYEPPY